MTRKTFKARLNAGELSPLLMARADTKVHADGLAAMANWLPLTQGGAARRPGMRYMGEGREGYSARLVPFVAGPDAAYVLAFTDLEVRVWTKDGPLLGNDGGPLALATPYTRRDLDDGLSVAQSADVMWICHPRHAPRLIKRLSRATFAIEAFEPEDGPFEDVRRTKPQLFTPLDPDMRLRLIGKGPNDAVHELVSVNGSAFYSRQEGRLIRLMGRASAVKPWEPGKGVDAGDYRRVENRFYKMDLGGPTVTTGTVRPTHTRGVESDGGALWEYVFDGTLVLRVEDWVGSTKVKVRIVPQRDLPRVNPYHFDDLFGDIDNVDVEFSSWDDYVGWPSSVAFYQERLVLARGQDLFFSKAGDFFAFADQTAGETLADDAIRATIAQERVEAARWLVPFGGRLVIGTEGGLLAAGPATTAEPFGPGNLKVEPLTRVPCAKVGPAVYEGRLAFVQGQGSKLREAAFGYEEDGLVARDFTVLAEHLGEVPFKDLAYQAEPDPTLWLVRKDGLLLSCTREVGENVTAWARHPLGADWRARGLAVVPEDGADRVWLSLSKGRRKAIVRLGHRREADADHPRWPCLDLFHLFGTRVDEKGWVDGLDAFEGEAVWLRFEFGPWLAPRKVEGGRVSIGRSERPYEDYGEIVVGLAYASTLETPPLALASAARVHKLGVVALMPARTEGLGLNAGSHDRLHPVFKTGGVEPPPRDDSYAVTGLSTLVRRVAQVAHGGGFTDAATLRLTADGPEPATILALTAEWEASS